MRYWIGGRREGRKVEVEGEGEGKGERESILSSIKIAA